MVSRLGHIPSSGHGHRTGFSPQALFTSISRLNSSEPKVKTHHKMNEALGYKLSHDLTELCLGLYVSTTDTQRTYDDAAVGSDIGKCTLKTNTGSWNMAGVVFKQHHTPAQRWLYPHHMEHGPQVRRPQCASL